MKVVLSVSGGLDSGVLLAELLDRGDTVLPVTFCYGSKHNTFEIDAAKKIVDFYSLQKHRIIEVSNIFNGFTSSLLEQEKPIPEGDYRSSQMDSTVVPARNLIFSSILSGIAETEKADCIALGVHAGDIFVYPDCRPEFVNSLNKILLEMNGVGVIAPFLALRKKSIVEKGLRLNFPFELTRTCYKPQKQACGKCGACVERIEAFISNSRLDPIRYEV